MTQTNSDQLMLTDKLWSQHGNVCMWKKNGDLINFISSALEISHFLWVRSLTLSSSHVQSVILTWNLVEIHGHFQIAGAFSYITWNVKWFKKVSFFFFYFTHQTKETILSLLVPTAGLGRGSTASCQGHNVFIVIPPPSLLCQRQTFTNIEHLNDSSSSHQKDSILQEVEVTN